MWAARGVLARLPAAMWGDMSAATMTSVAVVAVIVVPAAVLVVLHR